MLLFENIQKYYRDFLALQIPSLIVNKGIWWVQGENGSGKTTFLKITAGLLPFTGKIILEKEFSLHKQRFKYLNYVNYAEAEPLYPSFLTAEDLVALYCYTKKDDISNAIELLKQLHIHTAYNKPIGSYSSGMIKKLSLALAFIGKPKIILLDEPLITIDAHAIDTICHLINIKCKEGISFIITSHQPLTGNQLKFTGKLYAQNKTITRIAE